MFRLIELPNVQVCDFATGKVEGKRRKIELQKPTSSYSNIKKTCRFNTNRLVIENGLSNIYQNPNPFLNVISIILSKPVYTLAGVAFISPTLERFKK